MSEAVVQYGAVAAPTGGGTMRRLHLGTAVAGGVVLGLISWLLAHHFLQTDEPASSDQVTTITLLGWAVGFMTGIVGRFMNSFGLTMAFAIFVTSIFMVPLLGTEFVPKADFSETTVNFYTPVGSSLEATEAKARQVEAIIGGKLYTPQDRGLSIWQPFGGMTAVRRKNLFTLDEQLLTRPGPRVADGAATLCTRLEEARSRR